MNTKSAISHKLHPVSCHDMAINRHALHRHTNRKADEKILGKYGNSFKVLNFHAATSDRILS